jgi:hypothetical protein
MGYAAPEIACPGNGIGMQEFAEHRPVDDPFMGAFGYVSDQHTNHRSLYRSTTVFFPAA